MSGGVDGPAPAESENLGRPTIPGGHYLTESLLGFFPEDFTIFANKGLCGGLVGRGVEAAAVWVRC